METDRFPVPLLFRPDRYTGDVEALSGRPGIFHERDRGDEWRGRNFLRFCFFFYRRVCRTADRAALGAYPVFRLCIACHALLPGAFICYSDARHVVCRYCLALGELRHGDDRCLYYGDGLRTPRTGRYRLYDTDSHYPFERDADGDIERKDCRPYRLSRIVFL